MVLCLNARHVTSSWLRRFAWLPLIATAVLWSLNLWLIPIPAEQGPTEWLAAFAAIASVFGFGVVGSYLAYRLPTNAVGWVLAGFGFWFTLGIVLEDAINFGAISGSVSRNGWHGRAPGRGLFPAP